MGKEEGGGGSKNDQIRNVGWPFVIAFKVERTDLRNEELEIIPESRCEIRVNSAKVKIGNSLTLVSIEPHEVPDDRHRLLLFVSAFTPVQVQPASEALPENLLGNCARGLAEAAA